MRLSYVTLKSVYDAFSRNQNATSTSTWRKQQKQFMRLFSSASPVFGNYNQSNNSAGSIDDFDKCIFSGMSRKNPTSDDFFEEIDRLGKERDKFGTSSFSNAFRSDSFEGLHDSFNSLSDGVDRKLKKAASYFEFDADEIMDGDYAFRPDVTFRPVNTYDVKDLDLTKPGVRKFGKKPEFEVTSKEVLKKADFRNVRFLANFLSEAGTIVKRKQTKISAKAQRKVAREIKTARAFGLMPFTTMGTKSFIFGKTMAAGNDDFEYESYNGRPIADADVEIDPNYP